MPYVFMSWYQLVLQSIIHFQDNKAIGEKYGIHPRDVESKLFNLCRKKWVISGVYLIDFMDLYI